MRTESTRPYFFALGLKLIAANSEAGVGLFLRRVLVMLSEEYQLEVEMELAIHP